ncbi:MAG: trans-aconitate 2-methyltransferase [Jatrophihabitantaceae bacterium]
MSQGRFSEQVLAFAHAPSLDELPAVVDVARAVPVNPPERIQMKFVGLSYEAAYAEAESFVAVADQFATKHGPGRFTDLGHIVDFGSGWGRITRTLLLRVPPTKVHALDVDSEMTALVNTTLPGVNALTVSPQPPTVLGNASVDAALAFSVFSHLSGPAHEAWAAEFGRIVAPGGAVAITVLDTSFFAKVAGAQAAVRSGSADAFATDLATTFADLEAAQSGYADGEIQYAGSGGGEIRTGDYYGWAVAPPGYIERVWGTAGFRIVEWVPAETLFPQALVFLIRGDNATPISGRELTHHAKPPGSMKATARVLAGKLRRELRPRLDRLRRRVRGVLAERAKKRCP